MSYRTVLVAALATCAVLPTVAAADVRSDLETLAAQFESKMAAGDGAGIAAMYAEDAQVLPPQSEPVVGRAAIQEFWQGMIDSAPGQRLELEVLEVYDSGELATEHGRYVLRDAAGTEADHGKYIVIWRKDEGSWMLLRDLWNSSVAPPAPQ